MGRLRVIVLLAVTVPCLGHAQTAQQATPDRPAAAQAQPAVPTLGPEYKKLATLVGDWTYQGESRATALGAAQRYTGKATGRSVLGGFFVEWRWQDGEPSGSSQEGLEIHGYDPTSKRFTLKAFDSDGGEETVTYTFEGNTMTFSGFQVTGGQKFQIRGTSVFAADRMSFVDRWETSLDGATWTPASQTRYTKARLPPK
jgi:hypothetical protein